MSILPLARRTIADSWRALIGWSVGIVGVLLLYLPLYPDIGGNGQLAQILEGLPDELVNTLGYAEIGTGAGYTQATFFGLIGYLLVVIAAISWGASAIAGAEESGRLELQLAHAVGRVQYALEAALAIVVKLAILGAVAAATVWMLDSPAELDLTGEGLAAGILALLGLALLSGTAALAVGALTGRRVAAIGAGAGVAVYGYVINAIANQSDDLETLRVASPYSWAYASEPLANGFDPAHALLWAVSAVLVVIAALALNRRDVLG